MNTLLSRQDPRLADAVRRRAGWALAQAGCTKKLGTAAGISTRLAQSWCAGDDRSLFGRCVEVVVSMVMAGMDPWPFIVHLRIEARAAMARMGEAALRARARRLMAEETRCQGELDLLQIEFDPDDVEQLAEGERLATEHAARLEEMAANFRELRRIAEDRAEGRAR